MNKTATWLLCLCASFGQNFAQTDEINLQKYWKFRNELRESYVKIGPKSGEGITARLIQPNKCFDNVAEDDADYGWGFSTIQWGDDMIRHGYYLGLLATEYKLLKDAGEDVSGLLNEIYYALNTINRLDLKAEKDIGEIYGLIENENLNGFYMRNDTPEGLQTIGKTQSSNAVVMNLRIMKQTMQQE